MYDSYLEKYKIHKAIESSFVSICLAYDVPTFMIHPKGFIMKYENCAEFAMLASHVVISFLQ